MRKYAWAVALIVGMASAVFAQQAIDGIQFVDRNLSGDIVLGAFRGSMAVLDYDRDGFPDLVLGNNYNQSPGLFHNVPDGLHPGRRTFANVTGASGLDAADIPLRSAIGVVAADYDNDGDEDVYFIGRSGPTPYNYGLLFRNNGNGTFSDVSLVAGIRVNGGDPESASWNDFDLDGDVDLLIAGRAAPYMVLLRNDGGTFSDASSLLPSILSFSHAYSHAWYDYDSDGYADCFILTNSGANHDVVLHNISDGAGGRRFENTANAIGFVNLGPAPMGLAFGDYDGDGDFDIGISTAAVGTYFYNSGGVFTAFPPFATMFGWGVDWLDVENDGDVDFFTAGSWSAPNPNNLQRNLGNGSFSNISVVLNGASEATQHSVQVDFNNDGRQDILANNPNNSVSIYENVSVGTGHWVMLDLVGDGVNVNRDAIGALIRVKTGGQTLPQTQMRLVLSGSSTTSTEDLRQHFGIGAAATIDEIEVVWPRSGSLASRTERYIGPFAADQVIALSPTYLPGDTNCDGTVNPFDIQAFITALTNPGAFGGASPGCNLNNADANHDGTVGPFDIQAFIDLLSR